MATAVGSTIGALKVVIGADTSGLTKGLNQAGVSTAKFNKTALVAAAGIAAIGAAALAAGAKMVSMARDEMQVIDAQAKLTRAIGGTVNGLRAFKLAAEDMGIDDVEASLNRFNRRMGAAEFGAGAAAVSVKALGLDLKALAGMDIQDRMASIADTIQASGMSAQQAARHLQNMGFEQRGVAELFMQGGDAIRASTEALDKYGLAVSQMDAARIEAANDAFQKLDRVTAGLKTQLAIALAPTLLETGQRLAMVAENFLKVATATSKADDKITDLSKSPFVTHFVQPTIMGLARLIDVLTALGRIMSAIKGSFEVVGNDLLALAAKARTAAQWMNPVNIFDPEALESAIDNEKAVLAKRTQVLKDANQAWQDVWDIPANQYEQAAIAAFSAPLPDVAVPSGGGSGGGFDFGGGGAAGGGAAAKENDQLQQRLENLREFLATREELEIQAGLDRVDIIAQAFDAGLIAESDHNQMLFDLAGKFYESMATLRDEKYQEQRDKLKELNELDIISGEEYHALKMEMLAEQEQEKTDALIEAYLQRKGMLDEMVAEGDISEEEHRLAAQELEQAHQDELTRIAAQGEQERANALKKWGNVEMQMRGDVVRGAIQLLDQFAGKSKAAALASIVVSKGLAIAETIMATQAASMRALAELGPIAGAPVAAKITALGAAKVGIIAATGLAQAAGAMSSGGGGSLSGGASSSIGGYSSAPSGSVSESSPAPRENTSVTINLQGESYSRQQVRDLIEQINEATAEGATLRLA